MKKALYLMGLVFALASCSDDVPGWLEPQSNDPEDAKTVEMTVGQAAAVDYANISDLDNTTIQLFVPTITAETGAVTEYRVTLYNDDKSKSAELLTDENGYVTAAELKAAVESLYGKAPTPHDIPLDIAGYTTVAGVSVKNVATSTINVTLVAPQISANYYVVGGALDWSASAASKEQKFLHSDVNVYDDPIFTIVIPASSGDTWFAIGDDEACDAIANNGDYSKLLGTTNGNGNSGTSGNLAPRTELSDDGSFKVESGFGQYIKITLNMMEYSYTIEPLNFAENIYIVGNINGTSWGPSFPLNGASFDGKYQGFYYINGEFKFKPNENDWTGDWEYDGPGKIADNSGSNCPAPDESGFYVVDVDLGAMTYSLTKIEYIDIVGGVVGGEDWNTGPHMTYNTQKQCWEADVELTGDFKFRGNGSWSSDDGNFGGTLDNIVNGSNDNITPTITGPVHVELYLSCTGKSYATITVER